MKIALIGYGAMGKMIEGLAELAERAKLLAGVDAAIDFSTASAVLANISTCLMARVPIVVGTTGWHNQLEEAKSLVTESQGALLYGANFSVGVNLFYRILKNAAEIFKGLDIYDPYIYEQHHNRKKDAPSGTALEIHKILSTGMGREIEVSSTRAGFIPGTHEVGFDSSADQITLTHTARNREGFASGALMAARWLAGKRGVFQFSECFDEIISGRK
jgi:4-hydroxy-tetrahydrodipicolinate reductase